MNILITGGAGFIGSSLSSKLIELRNKITIIDNFNSYYNPIFKRENIKGLLKKNNFSLYEGDITDNDFLDYVFRENSFDKVVHLAASVGVRNSFRNPHIYNTNNIEGTRSILNMVRKYGIKNFIFASSSSVYGNHSPMPFKEDRVSVSSLSPYAQSKMDCEQLCFNHHKNFGTKVLIFRLFTVYGPKGRPDMVPYIFTKSILEDTEISIFGDGKQKRDFTNIHDLTNGILSGLKKNFPFEIINLGSSNPIKLMQFVSLIENVTKKKARLKFIKANIAEMRNTYADISKARKILNYRPKIKLEEGMIEYVKWFKKNRM